MTPPVSSRAAGSSAFTDGLGTRTVIAEKGGEILELLRINPDYALVPRFEAALRDRVARLTEFRHFSFARIRRVDRLDGAGGLGIVSEHPAGARLSDVLAVAEAHGLDLDVSAALCLVRQLVPALAALHDDARDVAHGALGPERILVTPHARVVVTDHALGSALEQLRLSRERLWKDLQAAVPPGAGHPRLDHRADVMQLGVVALSLVLSRRLRVGDLRVLPELVAAATESTVMGGRAPLSLPLRRWLLRALQADPRGSYASAAEAQQGLDEVLADGGGYVAAPVALEAFLARFRELAGEAADDARARTPRDEPTRPVVVPAPAGRGSERQEPPAPPEPDASRPAQAAPSRAAAGEDVIPGERRPARRKRSDDRSGAAPRREEQPTPTGRAHEPAAPGELPPPDAGDTVAAPVEAALEDTAALAEPDVVAESRWRRWQPVALAACAAIAIVEGVLLWWIGGQAGVLASSRATLHIESRPAGLTVFVDGHAHGKTPVTVDLAPGARVVELRGARDSRVLPVHLEAGRVYSHYIEMPALDVTGAIEIREYRGARVLVNGQLRGTAPLKIADLPPGAHELVLETRSGRVRQVVDVRAGLTTTYGTTITSGPAPSPPAPAAAPAARPVRGGAGIVRVDTPYEMQVFTGGRLLGTTGAPIDLPAGRHRLEMVSETLGFRTTRDVEVGANGEATVSIELPRGALTLESTPPAEAWVDGTRLGETPIYDAPVAIGPHQVTFKHPDLGEQHHAVVVTATGTARVRATFAR
jgi:hypothetical protein